MAKATIADSMSRTGDARAIRPRSKPRFQPGKPPTETPGPSSARSSRSLRSIIAFNAIVHLQAFIPFVAQEPDLPDSSPRF